MPTDCSTIDLATLNTAQGAMVTAMRGKVCQWEQDSAAIAADLLLNTISIEFSVLFSKALTARFDDQRSIAHYSVAKQVLNAVALEVAAESETPEMITV
jgi:hypothetical protein